jgi:hypothetical protein
LREETFAPGVRRLKVKGLELLLFLPQINNSRGWLQVKDRIGKVAKASWLSYFLPWKIGFFQGRLWHLTLNIPMPIV